MSGTRAHARKPLSSSISEVINERARQSPDKIFLIDPATGEKINFATLQMRVASVAAMLFEKGIQPGEAVAFATGNSPQSAIVILGILYGGFLATAINLVAGKEVISYVLDHSEAKLVLANKDGQAIIENVARGVNNSIPVIVLDDECFARTPASSRAIPDAQTDGLLMYTSGTTGRPKGVILTHENLLAGGKNTMLAHQLTPQDRGLCVLPLYHINGLCVTVMGALVSGGSVVIPSKFSVSAFWHTIIEQNCNWFSVVPTQVSYLLHDVSNSPPKGGLANVRFGRCASAPLSPDVQSSFEDHFGISIIETMGLTETAAPILSNPLPPGTRKIGSTGIAFGNEIKIADASQNAVEPGLEGEILVRGPNVMRGYLKNESATREAITDAGWLRTGDLGRMDQDGYVYVTGRLKELIIKGGENIAPREVDEALYSHPDVIEAAAFAKKCDIYGETVEAAVMLSQESTLTELELLEICINRVGKFKCPDRVYVLPELPKGPSGKIQRNKVAKLVH
jgi:acyl-CoA synthetase (AMP-forming)/AMP-acid ligase II